MKFPRWPMNLKWLKRQTPAAPTTPEETTQDLEPIEVVPDPAPSLWVRVVLTEIPVFPAPSTKGRTGTLQKGARLPVLKQEKIRDVYWAHTPQGWVVLRDGWGTYSVLEESPEVLKPLTGNLAPWSAFSDMLPAVAPATYKLRGAQVAGQPKGKRIPSSRIGNDSTNCTNFTVWLVPHALGFELSNTDYAAWQNFAGTDHPKKIGYGPGVCVEHGVAEWVELSPNKLPAPGNVYLIQHFKGNGGHSWLLLDSDPETGRVLTLEATAAWGVDGAGWAGIGNIRDVPNPGPRWRSEGVVWSSRMEGHTILAARLKVDHRTLRDWLKQA